MSYLTADEGYYYKDGLAGETVTGDAAYVAQYGVLSGGGVMYTVKYIDSASGAELAESYTGYANEGDVIPFAAKTVNGYDADSASKSITVADGAELSFLYTSNGSLNEVQYQYGETTTTTQTVTTPGTAETPETPETPEAPETPTVPEEEIDDNETPLGGGETAPEEESPSAPEEEIEDEDVPLAPGAEDEKTEKGEKNGSIGLIAAIGAVAVIAIVAAVVAGKKKKH